MVGEEEEGEEEGEKKVKLIKLTIDSWPEELSTHGVYRVNNRTTTLVTLLAAFR